MLFPTRRVSFWAALLPFALSSGCVTQRDHEALVARAGETEKQLQQSQRDVAALRADLDATRARLDNALRASADSSSDLMSSKARMNDLAGRVDETQHSVEELRRDVTASRTEIYARLDEVKRTQQPAPPPPPPVSVPQDKAAHYKSLEEAYGKKDWTTVRALGPEYVNRYSTDDRADEALLFVGDADREDNRPTSALGSYNRILKLFPRSNVLDRALYGMGEAYLMIHDCANAKLAYDAAEKRFSKEKIGADSRAKLATIAKNAPGLCAPQ
jgi:TolA-binding protein